MAFIRTLKGGVVILQSMHIRLLFRNSLKIWLCRRLTHEPYTRIQLLLGSNTFENYIQFPTHLNIIYLSMNAKGKGQHNVAMYSE